jgi:hypothetical protein
VNRKNIPALAIVLGLGLASTAWAADLSVDPFVGFYDSRANAMGGSHVALVDDFSSMLTNPAALVAARQGFSAARLDLGLAGPIFDIASLLASGGQLQTGLTNLLTKGNFYAAALSGPISRGYMGDGLGFGAFQRTHFVLDAASLTSITLALSEDFLIVGGYGFRIDLGGNNALDLGVLTKGYVRGKLGVDQMGIIDLIPLLSDPTKLLAEPFYLMTGIGIDAGIRWNWQERVSAGLVCRDAYSPALVTTYSSIENFTLGKAAAGTSPGLIDPDLRLGLAWKPRLGNLGRVLDGLTLALDYDDMLDLINVFSTNAVARNLSRNPILNVELGIEARVLDILSLRLGIKEALLQAGVDFDLDFAHVSVSAWGDELGNEPGERPVYNLILGMDFLY